MSHLCIVLRLHHKKIEQLITDSHSIMDTVFYDNKAATAIYKYLKHLENYYNLTTLDLIRILYSFQKAL